MAGTYRPREVERKLDNVPRDEPIVQHWGHLLSKGTVVLLWVDLCLVIGKTNTKEGLTLFFTNGVTGGVGAIGEGTALTGRIAVQFIAESV